MHWNAVRGPISWLERKSERDWPGINRNLSWLYHYNTWWLERKLFTWEVSTVTLWDRSTWVTGFPKHWYLLMIREERKKLRNSHKLVISLWKFKISKVFFGTLGCNLFQIDKWQLHAVQVNTRKPLSLVSFQFLHLDCHVARGLMWLTWTNHLIISIVNPFTSHKSKSQFHL